MNPFKAALAPVRVLLGVLDFGCEVRRELSRWEAHEDALNAAEADTDALEPGELRRRVRVDGDGRPAGFYTTLETEYAYEHYGFPRNPRDGDMYVAPDGGEWVWHGTGIWEALSYPPGGDPYLAVKAGEASLLSWGVDGATTQPPADFEPHRAVPNMDGYCMVRLDTGELCDLYEGNPIHTVSPVASAADVPLSVAVGEGPSEVCGDPPPPSEGLPLADLIAEVLAEHTFQGFFEGRFFDIGQCSCDGPGLDEDQWREHASAAIAERIEAVVQRDSEDADMWRTVENLYRRIPPPGIQLP